MSNGPPPMRVLIFVVLLHMLAAIVVLTLARRRRDYMPIAAFLAVTAVADILMTVLATSVDPAQPVAPLVGMERVVGHVRQALYLSWPFSFASMATTIFTGRSRIGVFTAAYVVTLAVLVGTYPWISGEPLRQAYTAIELGAIIVAVGGLVTWAWRRESPAPQHIVTVLLLATEIAVLFGPFTRDIYAGWSLGRLMYALTYLVLAISGGLLWRHSASDSQSS